MGKNTSTVLIMIIAVILTFFIVAGIDDIAIWSSFDTFGRTIAIIIIWIIVWYLIKALDKSKD